MDSFFFGKRLFPRCLAVAVILTALSGCHNERPAQPFPYAQPPVLLAGSPEEISLWVSEHYWDAWLDSLSVFSKDTALIGGITRNEFKMASNQYAALLSSIPIPEAIRAQSHLWNQLASREGIAPKITEHLFEACESLFYHPNSPYRNEDLYLPALQWRLANLREASLADRYNQQLAVCQQNRWGEVAADFRYQVPGKQVGQMHTIPTPYTLLIFSIPDCPQCKVTLQELATDTTLGKAIAAGQLTVLNLYFEKQIESWMQARKHYPKTWINAFDPDEAVESLYAIRATPSLYLLNQDKRVLLKDATPEQIIRALQ